MEFTPLHFYDRLIKPIFGTPPALEKTPDCPNGFIWDDKTYRVTEMLSSWNDFTRRGKMARNMQPTPRGSRIQSWVIERRAVLLQGACRVVQQFNCWTI